MWPALLASPRCGHSPEFAARSCGQHTGRTKTGSPSASAVIPRPSPGVLPYRASFCVYKSYVLSEKKATFDSGRKELNWRGMVGILRVAAVTINDRPYIHT